MKNLMLIRHAKSSWDFPELSDADRPLNKRGKKDAPEMGKRFKMQGIVPDLMVSSPAVRAYETAKYFATALDYPLKKLEINNSLYHPSITNFLTVINGVSDDCNSLMVFSHNPGITEFANRFCFKKVDNIVTAGVFAIQFSISSWKLLTSDEKGKLLFYDYPKNKL